MEELDGQGRLLLATPLQDRFPRTLRDGLDTDREEHGYGETHGFWSAVSRVRVTVFKFYIPCHTVNRTRFARVLRGFCTVVWAVFYVCTMRLLAI